jgi:siroheme synthase
VAGRAGEEIAALAENGIPVTVVPGITAALAMALAPERRPWHEESHTVPWRELQDRNLV